MLGLVSIYSFGWEGGLGVFPEQTVWFSPSIVEGFSNYIYFKYFHPRLFCHSTVLQLLVKSTSSLSTLFNCISSIFESTFLLKIHKYPFGVPLGILMRGLRLGARPFMCEVIESVWHPVGLCRESPKWLCSW
jgi:hypothetical protein